MYVMVQLTGRTSRETEIKLWMIANRGFSRGRPAPTIDRVEPLILAGLAACGSEKQTACPIVRWYQRQSAKNGRTNKSRVEPHTVQFLSNGALLLSIVLYWQSILSNSTGCHDIIKFSSDKFSGKRFSYINCFIIVIFISALQFIRFC